MAANNFIDLHCHPAMKPFGKSFGTKTPKQNSTNIKASNSVWFQDTAGLLERVQSDAAGFPPFTQCDFSSLAYGEATVMGIALYPLEKRFVQVYDEGNKKWHSPSDIKEVLLEGVTGIGGERINYIQQLQDYFTDMCEEYEYYKSLQNQPVTLAGRKATYRFAKNYGDVQANISANENRMSGDPIIISLINTIEGGHVFNAASYVDVPASFAQIKNNISIVKKWEAPPFFITFCHHYYNALCGHSRSLNNAVAKKSPQEEGINTGFTQLGKDVLAELLSKTNGKRIYIDIKHMSPTAREEYYSYISTFKETEKVPLIVSHGAVNGLASNADRTKKNWTNRDLFVDMPLNFFDDEIVAIAKSNGIFGIQMDERRIASLAAIKSARGLLQSRAVVRKKRSEFFWNQIAYMAELLDKQGLFSWGIQSIGSDNDGIINPINGFETAESLESLEQCLLEHATNYMKMVAPVTLTQNENKSVTPEEIVNRVMKLNAEGFLNRWFW